MIDRSDVFIYSMSETFDMMSWRLVYTIPTGIMLPKIASMIASSKMFEKQRKLSDVLADHICAILCFCLSDALVDLC
jgi:hypothetical protein